MFPQMLQGSTSNHHTACPSTGNQSSGHHGSKQLHYLHEVEQDGESPAAALVLSESPLFIHSYQMNPSASWEKQLSCLHHGQTQFFSRWLRIQTTSWCHVHNGGCIISAAIKGFMAWSLFRILKHAIIKAGIYRDVNVHFKITMRTCLTVRSVWSVKNIKETILPVK